MFICKRCGFETAWKHAIVRHLRKREPCSPDIEDVDRDDLLLEMNPDADISRNLYTCEHCQKIFSYRQSYERHIGICKKRPVTQQPQQAQTPQPTSPVFSPASFSAQLPIPSRNDIAVSIAALQAALHGVTGSGGDILSPRATSPLLTSATVGSVGSGGDELLYTIRQQLETLSREYSRLRSHTDFLAMAVMMLIRDKDTPAH